MYEAGKCNIGPSELKRRKRFAVLSCVGVLAYSTLIWRLNLAPIWRFSVAIPAAGFVLALQQVYNKFCVAFGLRGMFSFEGNSGSVEDPQSELARLDRRKAWKMIWISALAGTIYATLFALLSP